MSVLVNRDHIGIFGKMNAGKSTLMNLLTQQNASIVDDTPGTTTDTKIMLQEIHGMGPVKLFDTAGIDEKDALGEKKRKKVHADLKACDLLLLVIRPVEDDFSREKEIIAMARELDKQLLVIYNLFSPDESAAVLKVETALPELKFYQKLQINAELTSERPRLLDFILTHYESKNHEQPLLPFLKRDAFYILNIPMDEETPPGRYLRPQAMCEEYITRHWAYPVSFRMDLGKARKGDLFERERFENFIAQFKNRPAGIITDSQAMDIMNLWAPEDIPLTTFSIVMINYVSRGRLTDFYDGVRVLDRLSSADRVLIVEACNHSRIKEDIGTVQIPAMLEKKYPGVTVEYNFGREFQDNENLAAYQLIIHCGACMITSQKLSARLRDLRVLGIPYTNYGFVLSYMQGERALQRVMQPWETK